MLTLLSNRRVYRLPVLILWRDVSGIGDVLKSYGNRVRFVVRDYPLTTIHVNASAPPADRSAANAQGKFWEYIDILFKNQKYA